MFITAKALPTIKRVELSNKKQFIAIALCSDNKIFIAHIAVLSSDLDTHSFCQAQLTLLLTNIAFTIIFFKYTDFVVIFSLEYAIELSRHTKINNYLINLVDAQQLPYGLINSLEIIELEILKIYIKTILANDFIWAFQLLAEALIFFVQRFDNSLWLCIDYQRFNILTIKNQYSLSSKEKFLNSLNQAKCFT